MIYAIFYIGLISAIIICFLIAQWLAPMVGFLGMDEYNGRILLSLIILAVGAGAFLLIRNIFFEIKYSDNKKVRKTEFVKNVLQTKDIAEFFKSALVSLIIVLPIIIVFSLPFIALSFFKDALWIIIILSVAYCIVIYLNYGKISRFFDKINNYFNKQK